MVDIVVGPDAYRDLPHLVKVAEGGQKAVNVLLSREEMYAEINPVRLGENHVSAFVSIMRGCDNMCAFCVVPFTRGRERSRDPRTILSEVQKLIADGYKEVTLIGQNVDKYQWMNEKTSENVSFAQLLEMTALLDPSFRVRFSTSYPQDLTDDVLFAMIRHENICKFIHLPVQSGSSRILELMKRGYTREWYMNRIEAIRRIIPDCGISTDFIAGFCTETEEEHQQTLSLMEWAAFDAAFMFKYSERPNTFAAHNYKDDIPDDVKTRRLNEIIELQNRMSLESNKRDINKIITVLVEGFSKRSKERLFGRTSQNKVVIFPREHFDIGDYVKVKITNCTSATMFGEVVLK
jgi:tRNA-2-methylthio-N6-dimethylallyladenosine synthase